MNWNISKMTKIGNYDNKFQKEVSQMAIDGFPCTTMLQGVFKLDN